MIEPTPFHSDSKTYCKQCPKWKEVEQVTGFLKDNTTYYGFKCHGEYIEIPTRDVIQTMKISGPQHKSFMIDFNKKDDKASIT